MRQEVLANGVAVKQTDYINGFQYEAKDNNADGNAGIDAGLLIGDKLLR